MDKNHIMAAVRKALIAANPSYYSWPEYQQEIFRANISGAEYDIARMVLLKHLAEIKCRVDEVDTFWDQIPAPKVDTLNWAILLITGIGDDFILLHEYLADTTLLNFETLYDYDHHDHLLQQQGRKDEDNNYQIEDYHALRYTHWVRLIREGLLCYASLYSLAGYMFEKLTTQGNEITNRLIPNEYIEGKDNGKWQDGAYLWDMKRDAGGLEAQLEELNNRFALYLISRWTDMSNAFKKSPPTIFVVKDTTENELYTDFIFNNEEALKQVRWKHFLADCEPLIGDPSQIQQLLQHEAKKAESYLESQYQEIMQNFDPDILKLHKKRKIIIASDAFDSLHDDEEE